MRFLDDGSLPMHNNISELNLRRQVVGRRNWLFCGSEDGAEINTILVSLLASCRMHRIEPWGTCATYCACCRAGRTPRAGPGASQLDPDRGAGRGTGRPWPPTSSARSCSASGLTSPAPRVALPELRQLPVARPTRSSGRIRSLR